MFINGKLVKLGKKPVVLDRRKDVSLLQLRDYRRTARRSFASAEAVLPPVKPETSWITKLSAAESLPMYLNDTIGDCVEAAAAHMVQQWSFYAGAPMQVTDADVLKAYEDVGGFVPGNPATDNGTDMAAFLKYWHETGLGGHKIIAALAVDFSNLDEVQLAIDLFGNLFTGIQLPTSAQGQSAWTVPDGGMFGATGQPGSWGGHCIPIMASSPITDTCVTWGSVLKMSKNFFRDYVDEAFCVISPDWIAANGLSPEAIDLQSLKDDLLEMGIEWI